MSVAGSAQPPNTKHIISHANENIIPTGSNSIHNGLQTGSRLSNSSETIGASSTNISGAASNELSTAGGQTAAIYTMDTDISQLEAPTFTTLDRGPSQTMIDLTWDHKVNLIGKKVG